MPGPQSERINYHNATFLLSAARLTQLPPDDGVEVAFVGRSNAGKSSVLNQLTRNKKLARVSKTPGRTQLINVFVLDNTRRLIDLPGYGFAQVPPEVKLEWQKLLESYLRTRQSLKGLILVMDVRHPLTEFDQHLLSWATSANLAVHILLNKADKLGFGALKTTLREVKLIVDILPQVTCQTFSAANGDGADDLMELLDKWYFEPPTQNLF
jgi:GTP-binding protein